MPKPAETLGAEGYEELREQAKEAINDALFLIQGNNSNYECNRRIRIRSIQTHIEYEFDGVPFKAFLASRAPDEPAGAAPARR